MDTKKIITKGKKTIQKNVKIAQAKGDEAHKMAMQEYAKLKKELDTAAKKVENYVKNNPKKVALISAGIGAAVGAIAGVLASKAAGKKR